MTLLDITSQYDDIYTMYTQKKVTVYYKKSTSAKKEGKIKKGTKVACYGVEEDGWLLIGAGEILGYAKAKYLDDSSPENIDYVNALYTKKDKVGDGLDEERVGVHKCTEDGKYPLYQLIEYHGAIGFFTTSRDEASDDLRASSPLSDMIREKYLEWGWSQVVGASYDDTEDSWSTFWVYYSVNEKGQYVICPGDIVVDELTDLNDMGF